MYITIISIVSAYATEPDFEPKPTCPIDQTVTYEVTDFSGRRTYVADKLFCASEKARLSTTSGTLVLNADGSGTFNGTAQVVAGGCGTFDDTEWTVAWQIAAPPPEMGPKGQHPDSANWQLGEVVDGTMAYGNYLIIMNNKPNSLAYGNQVGFGANLQDGNFGGAFSFHWWLAEFFDYGLAIIGQGSGVANYDLECIP